MSAKPGQTGKPAGALHSGPTRGTDCAGSRRRRPHVRANHKEAMKFISTALADVTIIEIEPFQDERGFFARAHDAPAFAEHGLTGQVLQANLSYNRRRGTLRGLHYQVAPAQEAKHIRTIRGAAQFAVVDLRPGSATELQHVTVTLNADDWRSLFVPEGCAVGMQTLEDETVLFYQVSALYTPECERGLRHDDPTLGIEWPLPVAVISDKDRAWPLIEAGQALL
jgi:dTDP-4-dehydrorhamnose 3,5-epimerase